MNQHNQDFNYYTKGSNIFGTNYSIPPNPFYSGYNVSACMQSGVPMFPLYGYDNSEDFDKDVAYMKQLYPKSILQIQKEIDEECDKLEYDGSCMFDECPDKNRMNMIIDTVYEKVAALETESFSIEAESVKATTRPFYPCDSKGWDCPSSCDPRDRHCYPPPSPRPDYHKDGRPDWLRGLIGVLLFNEMNQRRRRYRSRKRWF